MRDHVDLEEIAPSKMGRRGVLDASGRAGMNFVGPVQASSLAGRRATPRQWVVDSLIPIKAVTLLSGDGGSGKSTLALQLACSMVLGRPWLGRATIRGRAAYVSCEDDIDELHRRLEAMCGSEDWDIADLDELELFDRVGQDSAVMLPDARSPSPWWEWFSNWVRDARPSLCVLDSLYDFFAANQLDQSMVRAFMGKLRELAHETETAIIILQHPSKSGMESGDGTSGNVAFRNAARAMLYLERDPDATGPDAPLILRGKKSNYGPAADELPVRWEMGRFVPVVPASAQTGLFSAIAGRSAEAAFLAALDAATMQGRTASPSKGANYGPKVFQGMPQAGGFKIRDLEKAMERLFASEEIEVGEVGRYANRSPRTGLRRKTSPAAERTRDAE